MKRRRDENLGYSRDKKCTYELGIEGTEGTCSKPMEGAIGKDTTWGFGQASTDVTISLQLLLTMTPLWNCDIST